MVKSAVGSVGKVASGAESATKGASRGIGRFMGGLDYKHTKQAEQRLKSEASPDSAGESRKVTRDTGGMKEASPPSAGTPISETKGGTSSAQAPDSKTGENRTLGGLNMEGKEKPDIGASAVAGETDSTASPAFSETAGTAASSGSRDLGGIEDKKSNEILETPGFAQQELTREKAGSSLHGSSAEYFPNTSVSKTRDGLNSGNSIKDSPYSAGGISENVTAREKTLPHQFPGSTRQPRTIAENFRAGYDTGIQKAEKRDIRKQQREERRLEKKGNRLK